VAGACRRNETRRTVQLLGAGRIRAKTAWDADGLRGDYADLLIMDEYAYMEPDAWALVGAPMLIDNDGDALFLTSPNRKNHAFIAYMRGLQDETGRWRSWTAPSTANPHLSAAALAELTTDMTDDAYRQEILAEFLDAEGSVFRNVRACLHDGHETPDGHVGHAIVIGVDWGQSIDRTAMSVVCAPCRMEVELAYSAQQEYAMQRARLAGLVGKWGAREVLAESNAMGKPIIEQLQRDGLPVRSFATTAQSKPPLIESLALALERGEVRWLADPVATAELEAYERKVSGSTGRSSYSAPAGVHDDTVIARALALRAVGPASTGRMFV